MKMIFPYSQWLAEMWDSVPNVKVLEKKVEDEDVTYTIDIEGNPYRIWVHTRRYEDPEDKDSSFMVEMHFGSKTSPEGEFRDSLTGRHNMQKVMGGIWWAVKDWARTVCKGGELSAIIVIAKTEEPGDDRRAKIYGDFLMRKAKQVGIKVLKIVDITSLQQSMNRMMGNPGGEIIATKYLIEPISPKRIADA